MNVQRSIHLRQGQLFAIPLEGTGSVFSGLLCMLFLEGGLLGASLKEVAEGFVQVSQGLLRANTGDLIEPGMIYLLFRFGESRRGLVIADTLLVLVVGIGTQVQGPIVDVASTAKRPSKNTCLLLCWIEPILVCSLLFHTSDGIIYGMIRQQEKGGRRHLEINATSSETSSGATSPTRCWTGSIRYEHPL